LNISSYDLYRQNGTNEKYLVTSFDGGEEEYEYKDTGVDVGKRYRYFITALNLLGESNLGDGFEIDLFSVPPTPRNLTAILNVDKIIISWNEPLPDTGWGDLQHYRLYRSKDTESESLLQEFGPEILAYEDRDIEENCTYHYSIRNVVDGIESLPSEEIEVIVPLDEPVIDDDTGDDDIIVDDDDGEGSTEEKTSISWTFVSIMGAICGFVLLLGIVLLIIMLVARKKKHPEEE